MAKITEEQLKEIKGQQEQLQQVVQAIGVLEVQKHEHLHQQAAISAEVEETKKKLEAEYGIVNIDLNDGSYEPIEDGDVKDVAVKPEK